jgi:hypothetical protein
MLAEKFILLMETLKSHASPDGTPRVVSTSPHVPVKCRQQQVDGLEKNEVTLVPRETENA